MSRRQYLQIWYQDPTAEAVICVPQGVKEYHPGVWGRAAIDDGGGGGDDATSGVREALFTLKSQNKGGKNKEQK